jgi:hypothetical protein
MALVLERLKLLIVNVLVATVVILVTHLLRLPLHPPLPLIRHPSSAIGPSMISATSTVVLVLSVKFQSLSTPTTR